MALIGMLAIGTACASSVRKDNVTFRIVKQGAMPAAQETAPRVAVATTDAAYRKMWDMLIGEGNAPAVDFKKESVVFVLAGERRHGGYSIEPAAVSVEGSTSKIKANVKGPGRGVMTIQVLTYPYIVLAIAQPKLTAATWLGADGNVVAATEPPKK